MKSQSIMATILLTISISAYAIDGWQNAGVDNKGRDILVATKDNACIWVNTHKGDQIIGSYKLTGQKKGSKIALESNQGFKECR